MYQDSRSAGEAALEKYMEDKRREMLPKFRAFPFKALSDLQGSSIQTISSHAVSIRSIDTS